MRSSCSSCLTGSIREGHGIRREGPGIGIRREGGIRREISGIRGEGDGIRREGAARTSGLGNTNYQRASNVLVSVSGLKCVPMRQSIGTRTDGNTSAVRVKRFTHASSRCGARCIATGHVTIQTY